MITSTKKYTKKELTDRTLREVVKANLYRQNHTKKHTHTRSQEEKGRKYIYIYIYIYIKGREQLNQ